MDAPNITESRKAIAAGLARLCGLPEDAARRAAAGRGYDDDAPAPPTAPLAESAREALAPLPEAQRVIAARLIVGGMSAEAAVVVARGRRR